MLAILALVLGAAVKWIKGKLGESNEQGDIVINELVDLARSKGDPKDIAIAEALQRGWNDASFTTDAMVVIYDNLKQRLAEEGLLKS